MKFTEPGKEEVPVPLDAILVGGCYFHRGWGGYNQRRFGFLDPWCEGRLSPPPPRPGDSERVGETERVGVGVREIEREGEGEIGREREGEREGVRGSD